MLKNALLISNMEMKIGDLLIFLRQINTVTPITPMIEQTYQISKLFTFFIELQYKDIIFRLILNLIYWLFLL